jgi:hypothetical protein
MKNQGIENGHEGNPSKGVGGAMTQIMEVVDKVETDIKTAGDYDQQIKKVSI